MTSAAVDLRCSAQARREGVDPAGTAVASDAFLLVEVPLPWPKEITDHACLDGVAEAAAALGARVQAVVPSDGSVAAGEHRVVLYQRPPGRFTGYQRREAIGTIDELARLCRSIADAPAEQPGPVDLLVCTHGARDRCCGALGTALFFSADRPPNVRVQRTSHTGGHRFAPTAVLLPEGTVWAWLDEALLSTVLSRSGDVRDVLPHYRGSTAMPVPAVQVAEREVLGAVGWAWLDAGRTGEVVERDGERAVVHLESTLGGWRAVVERVRTTPQPVCGGEPGAGTKLDDVLRLVALEQEW